MADRVVILGGGVGGMSAAHELAERGFDVEVFEKRQIPGGKARSLPVPDSGKDGREHLPAEHGFRFFPGFYWHLPDTMKRIPSTDGRSAFGHLVGTTHFQLAQAGGVKERFGPSRTSRSPSELLKAIYFIYHFGTQLNIPPDALLHFIGRLVVLMTSCPQRLREQYEPESWYKFCGADGKHASEPYKKFLAGGIVRTLVAAKADEISARTCGTILLQMLYHLSRPGGEADRVLDGPTNEVWVGPWLDHLETERNVKYHTGREVEEIECAPDGYITGVKVAGGAQGTELVQGDYYVFALPAEVMAPLVTDSMKEAEPMLAHLDQLQTRWMNGVMFYLYDDVRLVDGHTLYVDSDWALTSISQAQFWTRAGFDFARRGEGDVKGILSVDVSDWDRPGSHGKAACHSDRKQIVTEVWTQLQAHLNDDQQVDLADSNLKLSYLDEGIVWPKGAQPAVNLDPLLINTPGSWAHRPEATTKIENLFLAADYVRTNTDLATMEGANEAARRAVNGILSRAGSAEPECEVRPLWQPTFLKVLQRVDSIRYRRGKPHKYQDRELPVVRVEGEPGLVSLDEAALAQALNMVEADLRQPDDLGIDVVDRSR